jgi:8-oxo-dGTP pyrophosphatase MutT (NUDIX family)
MSSRNSWICDREKTIIDSPFVQFVERDCHSSEDGKRHRFYVLRSKDFCNIIPVTEDGKVVLVRQFRQGIDQHTLEIPGGLVDPTDHDLQAAAIREMIEETGYEPLPGATSRRVSSALANPAIMNNFCHSFIIGPVRRSREQSLDEGEMIDVVEVPFVELPAMIARGEINHGLILNAFLALALQTTEGEKALIQQLSAFTRSQ